MDLVFGYQSGYRFLFLPDFEDNLDIPFDGIVIPERAHNIFTPTPDFLSKIPPIHYIAKRKNDVTSMGFSFFPDVFNISGISGNSGRNGRICADRDTDQTYHCDHW